MDVSVGIGFEKTYPWGLTERFFVYEEIADPHNKDQRWFKLIKINIEHWWEKLYQNSIIMPESDFEDYFEGATPIPPSEIAKLVLILSLQEA